MAACMDCGGTECFCSMRAIIARLMAVIRGIVRDAEAAEVRDQAPVLTDATLALCRMVLEPE